MKRYGLLGALIGFVVTVLGFAQIPAVGQEDETPRQELNRLRAEQTAQEAVDLAWEISASAFGTHSYFVVKHNRVTGVTLILNCGETTSISKTQGCDDDSQWMQLPILVVE